MTLDVKTMDETKLLCFKVLYIFKIIILFSTHNIVFIIKINCLKFVIAFYANILIVN